MRIQLLAAALLAGVTACTPAVRDRCLVDGDCGGGRAPFCVDGNCVECVRSGDCKDGLVCSRDGLCQDAAAAEGEGAPAGEGEGASSGEGEGAQGGEGEGAGTVTCDIATCDAATEVCGKLLPGDLSSCFELCTPGTACQNVWGQAGACDVVDGENVCVATGGFLSVCSAFGNSRCDAGLSCILLAPAVSQCLTDCTSSADCTAPAACFDFGADGKHCFAYAEGGERCGFLADGTWRFCDVGFACAYANGVAIGTCAVDANDDGIPDGDPNNPDPTTGGGSGGGGGGGEGEGEGEGESPPCATSNDCVIASFGTRDACTSDDQCNAGSITNNDVCVPDSQSTGYCVLVSTSDLPCEQMPTNPPLTTVDGTDASGATVHYCAKPTGVFCSVADNKCHGPPWHN